MEQKMEEEKKSCIENTDTSASQCNTISTPDTNSQDISSFGSLSSEEPKWSSAGDSAAPEASLDLHSGISFNMSESNDSANTLGESCSFSGSSSLMKCEDSSQPKTCSPDATPEKVVTPEPDVCEKESFLKPDSSSSKTNLPLAVEICTPDSVSPSGNADYKDTFKGDFDCRHEAGSTDVCRPGTTDVCRPGSTDVCRPGTTDVCRPGTTDVCRPGSTDVCRPGTTDVCRPGTADVCRPGSTDVCRPGTTDVCRPGTTDVCRPGTADVCRPGTTDVCRPGTTDVCRPGTTDVCRPGTADVCRPGSTDVCRPGTTDVCRPGSTDVCRPGTTDVCRPGTTDVCRPGSTDVCRPEAGSTDLTKGSVSDNSATKKRSFTQVSSSSKDVCDPSPDSQQIDQDPPRKKFKPELQVGKENQDGCISDSPPIADSGSSRSLPKSTSVEPDSCLEDVQEENTCEPVSPGENSPLETETTELDQVEDEYRPYNFSQAPKFLTHCSEEFKNNNFLKGCKWAPDGSCLLTNSDDCCLRLFNLPEQVYNSEINDVPQLGPVLKMQESGTVYDYCWFPGMSSAVPETCCLVSTSKDTPVHMWDAFTSELRCTYRAYDQVDEITAAHSLAFSLDGQKLYCGFNKMIRIFDVERPGRQFTQRPTHSKKNGGQAGIISCISPSPVDHNLYATGSYSKEIALYWEPAGNMMCMFQGHQGGVTHIQFSPDGNRIYSGGRKDPEILCWDLRNPGTILFTLLRQTETNQRIYFDLDRSGRYMMSGNHDGTITVWDTLSAPVTVNDVTDPLLYPCLTYPAHNDTTNGISIHPSMPIVASCSGQRHFSVFDDSGSEDEDTQKPTYTNDLRLWWFT